MPAVSQFTPIDEIVILFDLVQAKLDLLEEETRLDVVNGAIFIYEHFAEAIDRLCDHRGRARLTLAGWCVYGPVTYIFEFSLDAMVIVDFVFDAPPDIDPDGTGNVGFFILALGERKRAKKVTNIRSARMALGTEPGHGDGNAVRPIIEAIAAEMARPRVVADRSDVVASRVPHAIQRALVREMLDKSDMAARRRHSASPATRRRHGGRLREEDLIIAAQAALLPTQLADLVRDRSSGLNRRKRDPLAIRETALSLAERYQFVLRFRAMRGADLVTDGLDLAAFIAVLAGESVRNTRRAALAVKSHARRSRQARLAEQALASWLFRTGSGHALRPDIVVGQRVESIMPHDSRLSAFFTAEAAAQWSALLDGGTDKAKVEGN
ncbi:hypothetical protein [Sphingomonas sp.]|uniref:hypothetical protein n=1 Tax=Sphingomonas sp. TaxID=28214 RepID=UPI002E151C14|nr:hypothetical protein [Sphingomonas sp.]